MIKPVKNPWKNLKSVINDIIDAVNRQKPLRGYGLYMDETPSGTFIATVPIDEHGSPIAPNAGSSSGSGSGPGSDDDSSLQLQISLLQAQVQILQQEMPIGTFQPVTVVDSNCAQSTISVFVKNSP